MTAARAASPTAQRLPSGALAVSEHAYTEQDRIEYDRWLQLLPPGSPYEAIFHLVRLQVRHDTAGLQMAVRGYEGFLRDAEGVVEALRPLPDVVTSIRADVDRLAAEQAELKASILERRKALDARVVALAAAPPRAPRWVSAILALLAVADAVQFILLAVILWRLL